MGLDPSTQDKFFKMLRERTQRGRRFCWRRKFSLKYRKIVPELSGIESAEIAENYVRLYYSGDLKELLRIAADLPIYDISIGEQEAEEGNDTADFLRTFPISRAAVLTQKLFALFTQVIALNAVVMGAGLLTTGILNNTLDMRCFILLHIKYLIMQLEVSGICFGISAFIKMGEAV